VKQAQVVGERLRKAVEGHRFEFEGKVIPVTISVGIAVLPNPAVKDASDIVGFADQALYKSKNAGRNRVTVYEADNVK
jgi:diguanylate cyclase (GGDEF)-like protein